MRKNYLQILAKTLSVIMLALSLSACSAEDVINSINDEMNNYMENAGITGAPQSPTSAPALSPTPTNEPEIILPSDFKTDSEKAAAKHTDDSIKNAILLINRSVNELKETNNPEYELIKKYELPGNAKKYEKTSKRDKLNDLKKSIYDSMYDAVKEYRIFSFNEKADKNMTFSNLMTAFDALCMDHPEIRIYTDVTFEGYEYYNYYYVPGTEGKELTDDTGMIDEKINLFNDICNRIVSCMPKDYSDYNKYRYIAYVIADLAEYDHSKTTVGNYYPAYNCLVDKSCVCAGYASAFKTLSNLAGLNCEKVNGSAFGEDHAWNSVVFNEKTYYVDVTWADTDRYNMLSWDFFDDFFMTYEEAEEGGRTFKE